MIVHHFIYVFCKEARDLLLKKGYALIKEDTARKVYVFENRDGVPFTDEDYAYVLSDTLSL